MYSSKCAVAAALLLIITSGILAAAPRLEIPDQSFDFGYVPQNAKVSHDFWLRSVGDDTLRILKVVPGCGCTQAPLERDAVASGDSARLQIIFDSGRFSNRIEKRPRIQTNEGAPDKTVRIMAHVVTRPDSTYPVIVAPYKLDLSQFGSRSIEDVRFTVTNVSDRDLGLNLVSGSSSSFTVTLPRTIIAGESAEGFVVLTDHGKSNAFESSFTFEVNDPAGSRFTVPVKRSIRAAETEPTAAKGYVGGQ